MLYFLAEGAVILFLFLLGTLITNEYILSFPFDLGFTLILSIFLFVGYVLIRYILSGMEFTDIATKETYKKQLKVTIIKSVGFGIIFFALYAIVVELPVNFQEWIEMIGFVFIASMILKVCFL